MNYTELVSYLETILVDQEPSADLTTILPAAIQYAEGRIYRELDFLKTRTVNSNTSTTPGVRTFTLPTTPNVLLVIQGASVVSPAGNVPSNGKRNPCTLVSLDYLDMCFPTEGRTGLPTTVAMLDNATMVFAKTPDAAYVVELTGIFRPAAMSGSNLTTYIGDIYPSLLVAACMIFLAGYQRDYGQASDDPKLAISWESQYQTLMKSALEEEQRRKGSSTGWSPFQQTLAQPPRT